MLAGELAHRFGIVAGASEDPHIMINGVPRDMSAVESVNGRKMRDYLLDTGLKICNTRVHEENER